MHDAPTQVDTDAELDRQMVAITRGESSILACPFCGCINSGAEGNCCPQLQEAKDRRGERNIKSIERQRHGVVSGLCSAIDCPYCGGVNQPRAEELHPSEWVRPMRSPYCCDFFQAAITAVMYAVIEQRRVEHYERIRDGIAKAENN
jgi:hypothetical protein